MPVLLEKWCGWVSTLVVEGLPSGFHRRPSHSPTGFPHWRQWAVQISTWWQASVSEAHPAGRRDQGLALDAVIEITELERFELLCRLQVASYIEIFRVLCVDDVGFGEMWMEHEDGWNVVAVLGSERELSCII